MKDLTSKQPGYATKDALASIRSLEFEEEAEKVLELDRTECVTTRSSGLACMTPYPYTSEVWGSKVAESYSTLLLSHGAHGQSTDGSAKFSWLALRMAQRMKLFGVRGTLRRIGRWNAAYLSGDGRGSQAMINICISHAKI